MTVLAAIQAFAETLADQGEGLAGIVEIRLNALTFERFKEEMGAKSRIDLHEVGGDYDRPTSPWFGSRPSEDSIAYWVYVDAGHYVRVKGPR